MILISIDDPICARTAWNCFNGLGYWKNFLYNRSLIIAMSAIVIFFIIIEFFENLLIPSILPAFVAFGMMVSKA